jgi:hypothetical protein
MSASKSCNATADVFFRVNANRLQYGIMLTPEFLTKTIALVNDARL